MSTNFPTSPETSFQKLPAPVRLDSGRVFGPVTVGYRTWGTLSERRDNAVLVCHALTGSADVDRWWGGLLGKDRALDPSRDFIICTNVLGGCYGTSGPASLRPGSRTPYGPGFPEITIRDMVRVQAAFLAELGVKRLRLVIGGSMGGMQALEWGLTFPGKVDSLAVLATSARHSAWCIALSEAQRQAIYADPNWKGGYYTPERPPSAGLSAARMMAMCAYRSRSSFEERFSRRTEASGGFEVESWLGHHGQELVRRFDANTYITLTRAMDTHDVGRERGGVAAALGSLDVPALIVAIDSDVLYPPVEQREIASLIPDCEFTSLSSPHGHDAFLIEESEVNDLVCRFRRQSANRAGIFQEAACF